MNLSEATSQNLIFLDQAFRTKDEIFSFVAKKMQAAGIVSSAEIYKQALYDREAEGLTGFENGLAIPHGKSSTVKRAAFAVVRLSEPLSAAEYGALNAENKVELLFVLAIPEAQAATHLDLLAKLSTRLGDAAFLAKFKEATSATEVLAFLGTENENESLSALTEKTNGLILGVTACAAGIAHTYMAAEAIVKAAARLGYAAKVEKQGANGLEDRLTAADVNQAVGVILAHDVALKDLARFDKLPKLDVPVAAPIKSPEKVVGDLLKVAEDHVTSASPFAAAEVVKENESAVEAAKRHLMTGVSYMLPFVVAGGMILSIGLWLLQAWPDTGAHDWRHTVVTAGVAVFQLMYPIIGAYIAYSIADKPALVVGMTAGLFANTLGAGYLGAILGGFVAGYLVKQMRKIKLPKVMQPLLPLILIPLFGSGLMILMMYTIGQPVVWLNKALTSGLQSMSGSSVILLGVIIGAMMAVDMGGPVNKAAFAFCVGMLGAKVYAPAAAMWVGIMTPPVALGLATLIAPKKFTAQEKASWSTAILGGLTGITEFAIPFAVRDPWRTIVSLVVGSAVGAGFTLGIGTYATMPSGGIFLIFLGGFHSPFGFLLGFAVAIAVTILMLVLLKKEVVED
ncbi:MAG: fructose-specific PTS transporter subunit EIIC [Streptococcaceae bacterium]|jgi:fructose-specific phosphotransferase system IIC component/fructose-specific phosphotransferase system IIA component/fructose-specific phosphotransferase system IIB component|nr:fructose-specific PTS transporter subunit EIIC [Streptococcaceae bacterium]